MRLMISAAVAALLVACMGTRSERGMSQAQAQSTAEVGKRTLADIKQSAESQAGRVTALTDDEIRVQTYGRRSAESRLELGDDEIPVFMEGARVGRDALRQGEDVRVYFESGRGANPRVVAVEVLSENEATRLREPQ